MRLFGKIILAGCLAGCAVTGDAAVFTGSTGNSQFFSTMQPSVALSQYVQISGNFPPRQRTASGGSDVTVESDSTNGLVGQFRTFAFTAPFSTPRAQGQQLPLNQNQALYAVLGTTYGSASPQVFNLPDLSGRTLIGTGPEAGTSTAYNLGQQAGSNTSTLTASQLPAHDHDLAGGGSTLSTGAANPVAFDNRQASLAVTYAIATRGIFGGTSYDESAIGQVLAFAGSFVPQGYAAADGRELSIAQNTALFALLGTSYGGNGTTTFRLPDLRGRTIVGAYGTGDATHLGIGEAGSTIGADYATLSELTMPAHVHSLPDGTITGVDGGGQPLSNAQPSLAMSYLVNVANGLYPNIGGAISTDYYLGEVIAYAPGGDYALPAGWMRAEGQLLSINQYAALYSLLGITYGGDGQSTFALPDLRGRAVIGSGALAGANYATGFVYGSTSIGLTAANLPGHTHELVPTAAIPEPGSWALMIGGFGLAGGALRRRATGAGYAAG